MPRVTIGVVLCFSPALTPLTSSIIVEASCMRSSYFVSLASSSMTKEISED